ncbi:MAG: type transporter, partial [Dehalococcoidia bacterium]|nr:type transporter [Dehalococcoidia bacterium]
MRWFSRRSLRLWQRDRDVFFRLWKSELPGFLGEPLFIILVMGFGLGAFIGQQIGGQRYVEFIAPGIIASYSMFSASAECTYGSFVRMEFQKTFDAIIATPLSAEDVAAGEIFWGATRSLLTSSVILAIIAVLGLVHSPWALLVPAVGVLSGLMFSSIGLFFTSLAKTIYNFNYYFTLFLTPMFFFSGIFFPLTAFPKVVQNLSWIVPLTPVARLTRGLVAGNLDIAMLWSVLMIVGLTAVFFVLALTNM